MLLCIVYEMLHVAMRDDFAVSYLELSVVSVEHIHCLFISQCRNINKGL